MQCENYSIFRSYERNCPIIWAINYTVWEDNESCITVAKSPKFNPWTKHIAIKYHHFRLFVSDGTIIIKSIDTTEQIADIFTKTLEEKSFCFLWHQIMGW